MQVFNDVDLAKTSAQQLWDQVSREHPGWAVFMQDCASDPIEVCTCIRNLI